MSHGQRYTGDVRRLLELCSRLEFLELHWYNLPRKIQIEAEKEEERFFTEIVGLDRLSQLRHCRLYGINTNEAVLLAFCKQVTQLCSLTMENIYLQESKYESVFGCLTNQLPHLDYLHLSDLYEERLICFDGPGEPRFLSTSSLNGPEVLIRTGLACQEPISYRLTQGRPLSSPAVLKWVRKRKLLYSPPGAPTSHIGIPMIKR